MNAIRARYHQPFSSGEGHSQEQSSLTPPAGSYGKTSALPSPSHSRNNSNSIQREQSNDSSDEDLPELSDNELPPPDYSFIGHALAPPPSSRPLQKPIALPQLTSSLQGNNYSPFARGYTTELQQKGVREHEFLEFIDNLNIVFTPNQPLKAMGVTGMMLGFSPEPTTQLIGTAMETAADIAGHYYLKSSVDNFLKRSNTEMFNLRGLEVGICDTKALQKMIGLSGDGVAADEYYANPRDEHVIQRRIQMLGGRVMPVSFDVPEPDRPDSKLGLSPQQAAWVAKMQEMSIVKRRWAEKEERKWQQQLEVRQRYEGEIQKLEGKKEDLEGSKGGKSRLGWFEKRKIDGEVKNIDKEQRKVEKELEKQVKKSAKKDPDRKTFKKVMWVVVKNIN